MVFTVRAGAGIRHGEPMTRSAEDLHELGASTNARRGDAPGTRAEAPPELLGEAIQTDDLAPGFFDKLRILAGFGLAAHTRLLLGRDG